MKGKTSIINSKKNTITSNKEVKKLTKDLENIKITNKITNSKIQENIKKTNKCGYCYDSKMLLHKSETDHVERPERILSIYNNLMNFIKNENIEDKFIEVKSETISFEFLKKYVSSEYLEKLNKLENTHGDTFINEHTYESALLSAGCTISCLNAIYKDKICDSAFAIVRPPGHHCCHINYQGFCFLNNVYLAYLHAKHILNLKKIVIVDWDVHYGDGTYELIKKDPDVVFFSLHRYEEKRFYPGSGDPNNIGELDAKLTKVNIGWNTTLSKWATSLSRVSDHEYIYSFNNLILPIIKEFNPELILISSGFDSAENDPLGEIKLTPIGYSYMTRELKNIAKVVVVLEGGYNLDSLSRCSESIFKTLIDYSVPYKDILLIKDKVLNNSNLNDIFQSKYFEANLHIVEVVDDLIDKFKEKWNSLKTIKIDKDFKLKSEKDKMIELVDKLMKKSDLKIIDNLFEGIIDTPSDLSSLKKSEFKDFILISFGSEFLNYRDNNSDDSKIDKIKYLELLNEYEQTTLKDAKYCIEYFNVKDKNSKLVSKYDLNTSDFYHILNDINDILKEKMYDVLIKIKEKIRSTDKKIYKITILLKFIDDNLIVKIPCCLLEKSTISNTSNTSNELSDSCTSNVINSLEYLSNFIFHHLRKNEDFFDENQIIKTSAGGCFIF